MNGHHLTYRSEGGTDEESNLQLIHADCHRKHHATSDHGKQPPEQSLRLV
ncbi:HNH endonuclease [Streptomyces sp. NPDC127117]